VISVAHSSDWITLHDITLREMLLMPTVDVSVLIAARVVITQGASLNLFSSREAEYEQRAQLLKRLSFTIYCSDVDQYQRHMPDIQGTVSHPQQCAIWYST